MPGRPRRRFAKRKPKVNKVKKLVTGQGPTLLERIAAQSNNIGLVAKSILPIALAINTEHKYNDTTSSGVAYNPGTNDYLVQLTSGIAVGTTDVSRVGNSILVKDMSFRFNLRYLSTTTVPQTVARIVLFVWKENLQDNAPTITKILETPAEILSPFNRDYTDQMVILKDEFIDFQSPFSFNGVCCPYTEKIFKKLDFHIRFDGTTSADGTVNHIYLLVQSEQTTAANQVGIEWHNRINYTDN